MSEEQDAPESVFSPEFEAVDDARYAEMAASQDAAPEREPEPEPESEEPGTEEGAETPPADTPPAREPLTSAQLEERLAQSKTAMKEERRKRREYETQIAELKAREAANVPEDPFDVVIAQLREDDEDPLHDITALKDFLRKLQSSQKAEREAAQTQSAQQAAWDRHQSIVLEQEAEFREDHPDYESAVNHFRNSVRAELADQGFTGNELNNAFAKTLVGLTEQAVNRGMNPAEVVYTLAQKRGYAPNTPPPPAPTAQTTSSPIDKSAEKIQTLNRSQQAGRSLSAVGGKGGDGQLTISSVSKLEGKALLDGYNKLQAQQKAARSYTR